MENIKNRFDLVFSETVEERKERRLKEKKHRLKRLKEIENRGHCEGFWGLCESKKEATWIVSMTRYSWDIDKKPIEDPNRDLFLCSDCEKEYNDHWQERWEDYYNGLL